MQKKTPVSRRGFLMFVSAVLVSAPCMAQSAGADSPEVLKATVGSAYAAKDTNALKNLYLPRADKKQIGASLEAASWNFKETVASVEWKKSDHPLTPSYTQDNVVHTYCPVPQGSVMIHFTDKSSALFLYGEENGRFYLVSTCS